MAVFGVDRQCETYAGCRREPQVDELPGNEEQYQAAISNVRVRRFAQEQHRKDREQNLSPEQEQ
jgi:hypothetical protein